VNIWDLDHIKNSQFPEHNINSINDFKNNYIKSIIFKAFKIIVPHENNKTELINYYKADKKNITTQNFIPMLPTIYRDSSKDDSKYKELYQNLKIPTQKKIIFYPAQFWAHKNHKYIVDVAEIMNNKDQNDYFFVFCGTDKGNCSYIKRIIAEKKINNYFKFLNFVSDDELISLYLNSDAVLMPTYGGPTNLPLYESFFFKIPIFYSKDLIKDPEINSHLIEIDLDNPNDFCEKVKILNDDIKIKNITKLAASYFNKTCDELVFKDNYKKILDEFMYLQSRWK
jgi:glycosyltransferase involved in cell wall biosynthesis